MSVLQYILVSVELWGAAFSIIATIIVILTRQFDVVGSKKLVFVMICSSSLMLCDCIAWLSRNQGLENGYTVFYVTYVGSIFFGFLLMPLVAEYVSHVIYVRTGGFRIYWSRVEWVIFLLGVALLGINDFHPFMFKIHEDRTVEKFKYFSLIPSAIVIVGLIMTLCVAIVYLKYMLTAEKLAFVSCLVLPIIGLIIGIFLPNTSFSKVGAVLSTIILFISYEVYYAHYLVNKEKVVNEARLRLINQQMHPHFIFNSLSLIRYLCKKNPDEAVEAVNEFSKFLRGTTDLMTENDCISVEKELDIVQNYMSIQKRRFGNNLRVTFDIRDKDFEVPPFSIQTIVENAVHHGVKDGQLENGAVRVVTKMEDNYHLVIISDNGEGFDTSIIEKEGNSVGVQNTIDRLRVMCKGEMVIESMPELGTKITFKIPV
ncbi:MAG: histidine kinase [Lachnospiraceae bacterium]|nr:histidine kinase [Lachnospiraceae bacterium]